MSPDLFDLQRFVQAQEGVWPGALAELQAGAKRGHWMWFVFPQVAGLGSSPMAQRYAVRSLEEAQAYLAHPLLGPRLRTGVEAMLRHAGRRAVDILGRPDDLKFRSCLTLFAAAAPAEPLFARGLAAFFESRPDEATLARLRGA